MFLATTSVLSAITVGSTGASSSTAPYYLISGDYAVYLYDTQTVQAFKKVGVPVVSLPTAVLQDLTAGLRPPVNVDSPATYIDGTAITNIDGGAPNSVLYLDDFDGGSATDYTVVATRTNLVPNPSPSSTYGAGGWGSYDNSALLNQSTVDNGGPTGGPFIRYTVIGAATNPTAVSGAYFNHVPVVPGASYTASWYVRFSVPITFTPRVEWHTASGSFSTITSAMDQGTVSVSANTWTRVSVTGQVPMDAVSATPNSYSLFSQTAGATMDLTMALVENAGFVGGYFDGDTPDTATFTYAWVGIPGASASTETANVVLDDGAPLDGNHL